MNASAAGAAVPATTIGDLLRTWRSRRSFSQLALASEAGVSPRHLSFVETGRSRPSPELVLSLADRLDVPLRDRNTMLLAAGYAPRFGNRPLQDEAMTAVRASLQRILDTHDPFPGLVVDRRWDVVMVNAAAAQLFTVLPDELRTEPVNLLRAALHPDGLARYTTNLDRWAPYLFSELDRAVARYGDPDLAALADELRSYPVPAGDETDGGGRPLVVTCDLDLGAGPMSLFTTLTTFGSPEDVTLDELLIELFFPADEATEAILRAAGAG